MDSDREAWIRAVRSILDSVADATRVLGIAEGASGLSNAVHSGAASSAEERMAMVEQLVRQANELGARVGEHPMTVPGEKPIVDLRPWWSRVLEKVSSTARRNTAVQQLETLRLEATDALLRSAPRA